ncbi:MAG: T9SS type B sorting domain-containing protein [Flavobacterium sp. JAD_PAG50586_2]|nr:MAG: T9SS type B sorting domain-containing protein [Flavobacterium sp. JAD_PAG50586_2]
MHILNTLLTRKIRSCLLIISVVMSGFYAEAQIYYHNFGTTAISTHPYTVAPTTFDSHLSGSSWTNSVGAWTSNAGATGEAIRLTTAAPATITLTFNVAANYQVDITSFDFWTVRSALGPQNWTMTINGINVGSGTTAAVGAALGNTAVANAISGLTGTITVVISLSGQTGNGTYRLDDFTLFGTVTPNCTAATITSFSPTSGPQNTLVTINGSGFQAGSGTSAVNFNGIPATSFTVVSDTLIKAYIPAGNTSGNISVVTNGCEGFSAGSFTVIVTTPNIVYATDLYISEIYDAQAGSGGVIEIYNGTASTINLSGYSIVRYGNIGGPSTYTLNLTGSIPPGAVFLINVGTTPVPCTGLTYGQTYPSGGFNSNDQFELVHNSVIIDTVEISQAIITAQPGYSITRNPNAIGPQPVFNINDWTLTGTEDCSDLGVHTVTPPNPLSGINAQPTSRIICENGTTTFSVTLANPSGYTFQWKVQSGTGNWINVVNSANYSGAMTSTLTLNLVPATFNNNQYYCQITSPSGTIVTYAAQLQVNAANNPPTLSTTPPTCLANGFTTITNYSASNTYTFSPTGPTVGTGGIITGAIVGTNYSVSVSNGCPGTSASFTNLAQLPTPLVPTLSTTAPTCLANGFTTITNYNASNTYTFSPSGPVAGAGGTITGAVLGTAYTVSASSGGCTSASSLAFTNLAQLPTPLVPTLSTTPPTCTADGFTTITNYNPANTYTFSPTGPVAGAGGTITGAVLGTAYTITASNGGCTSASSLAFTNLAQLPTPLVPTLSTTPPTCTADGFTTITNHNPAHTYTFSPTGPVAGAGGTITGAVLGTAYTVTASNGGCSSASSAPFTNLAQLPTPLVPILTTTPPTCTADGFTTITNYNPANTYTFLPTGPVAGAGGTITGAVLGTAYTITASNGGCTSASSLAFTNLAQLPTPLVPTLSTTAPTCLANGFTTITNYNASNTYTFSPTGPVAGAGGTITGAVLGTAYTITASNGGCTSASSLAFTNLAQLPTPLVPTLSTTPPTCTADGFTTITNYNPANTYTFSPTGPVAGAGGTITGAVLGTAYTITASNGGCTSASSLAFTNLAQLPTPLVPTLSTTPPTCTADGFTTITNHNPAHTYTFSPTGPVAGAGGTITGAVLGTAYTVTASNGGCSSASSAPFTNLAQLPTPLVPILTTTPPTCTADGFTTITNYNPANTYTFSPTGPVAGAGGIITGAVLGTVYTVTASNGGCTSASSAPFTNLVQLPIPTVPALSTGLPSCTADGFTTITNYNASNTYTFSPSGPVAGAGGTITGAVLGTGYTVTASNGGCSSASSAPFINLAQLPTPLVPILTTTPPTCTADGFTTITNYNPANTYTFSPTGPVAGAGGTITGAVLGTAYTVTASNGGCTSASSLAFTNLAQLPTPLVPTLSTTPPTCTADGFTTITNYNAANTYTFSPTGPVAGAGGSITGAVLGTAYTITASNGGCTSASSLAFTNLAQLPTPLVPTLSTTPPTCTADGFTTITNYNPANTYTFSPTGPVAGAGGTITGAVLGTAYTITASNGGCTSASSLAFTNLAQLPTPLVPTLSTTPPSCTADGFTTITNYNPAHTYTFSPTGPVAGAGGTITGAVLGTAYTITASNGGCTSASSLAFTNLAQLPTPLLPTLSTTPPTCTADGFTTITNYNPANTYTFLPTGSVAGAGGTITGAVLGTAYTITASNGGCTSASSLAFTNLAQLPTPLVPTLSTTPPTCTADGFTAITNYNPAHTYTFSPTGPVVGAGGTITAAVLGTAYTITASNGGCTSASSLAFTNLAQLPTPLVPTLSTTPPTCTADGFTTITNYNPANTYTFSPTGPVAGAGGTITGAVLGTAYTVTASNGGCTSAASGSFTNNPYLASIIFINPPPLQACDSSNDGFVTFNLTQVINGITGGNPNYTVSFHETLADATIGGTTVLNPVSYDNINPWLQTIYIRVAPLASPCFQILTLQLVVNPTPEATEPADYELCDYSAPAGVEAFDLTTRIPEILGSINPALTTVTFYTNLPDAQAPSNAIAGITNYLSGNTTLYVRVETTATGCFDIVTLNLVVNPLPNSLQPNYPQYSLCDTDQGSIGYEIFDLGSKINDILLGQLGMDVTFWPSLGDAQNRTNEITNLMYENAIQYVQTIGIIITNHATGCFVISTMDIRVEPLPTLTPPTQPYTLCDDNQDGYTTFDLTTLIPGLLNGITTYALSFHETIVDAQNNGTTIPNPSAYDNIIAFVQILYVRAEDINTHCVSITPVELNVNPSPIAPIALNDIVLCDDDSNPQNAVTSVDLTQQTADVLALQPLPAASYTVTYYTSQLNAEVPTGAIIPDTNYIGSNNEVIWVRVENNVTECYNVGSFRLKINKPLLLTFPTPLSVCDDDAVPNDQLFVFDLTIKNTEINQGTGFAVDYFPSLLDAQNNTNIITTPTAYLIQTPPVQTLGVVVTTADGCKSITTLDIRVLPIPTPRTNPPALAPKCDDNNPGDMLELFDLTVNEAYIRNGDPNLTFHYFRTQADAENNVNELIPANGALVGSNVWIRVENNRVDYLGNHCYVLVEQALTVNPLPTVIQPLAPYRMCDDNADGLALFDLANPILAPLILGTATTNQQPADYTITYHLTPGNAASGTAPLVSPYPNVTPTTQNIYIRVVNNATGCVNATGVLTLAVEAYATATSPPPFETCDTYADPYDGVYEIDLTQFETAILNGQNPAVFLVSYYRTQADADAGTNPLTAAEELAYITDPDTDTIWVKVENSSNSITPYCYALAAIVINVERYPNPIINTPNGVTTICVDFVTGAVIRPLTLNSGITNTADYTFEWFEAASPTTVIGSGPTYTVDTAAAGGATRSYTVHVTSISALGCDTTSAPFDVIQSGPAVIPSGTIGYTVTNAFSNQQIITVTVEGYGTYEYSLDDGPRQTSNVFENVSIGVEHTIHVWDTEGGIAYSCEELIIGNVNIIDYPHYFTPNGDGIHDTWNIWGLQGQLSAKIFIFDRYGKLLKQISSKGAGWDGTYNGHLLPSDDYWFTVDFEENSAMRQFKAHFTLKR